MDSGNLKWTANEWRRKLQYPIDGVLSEGRKHYLFSGDQYDRSWSADKVPDGYPKKISEHWHGLDAIKWTIENRSACVIVKAGVSVESKPTYASKQARFDIDGSMFDLQLTED